MDSTGATARTPRRPFYSPLPPSSQRSPGYDYGTLPVVIRSIDATTSQEKQRLNGYNGQRTTAAGLDRSTMKTPRHTYHPQKQMDKLQHEVKDVEVMLIDPQNEHSTVASEPQGTAHAVKVGLYGALNTVILIPVMISFAQIIFRDPVFQPYMADLVKLVLMSAAIHQICFTAFSSLPFAVGQVQDAGLIFLSAMATSTVKGLRDTKQQTFSMDEVLATTLFTLALSTGLMGIALVITGKLKIASFVQYLPMPVVGGYLAYIGFYCLQAALSTMSNKTIKNPYDWVQLADWESLLLISPGVIAGILIFVVLSRYDHVAVLPGGMFAILLLFYFVLLVTGVSLEDARAAGWISPLPDVARSIVEIYGFYDFSLMNFSFLTMQIPTWIAMYFVVAFSSSLDVAAVEMALGTSLNHNHELQTVGISNFVSGITGGFTGSYIFSQTIFTLRGKLNSRVNGIIIFLLEIAFVQCPVSVIAYVPKMFFGALQTLIAADLMMEWMWHARHKMLFREFAVVWFTFLVMNFTNLEIGILAGIVVAGFNFIGAYITASTVRRVMKRSRVDRHPRERALLQMLRLSIVTLELDGYIFFGSSVKMMDEVRRHVLVSSTTNYASTSGVHQAFTPHERSALLSRLRSSSSGSGSDMAELFDDLMTLDDPSGLGFSRSNTDYGRSSMQAIRTRFFILDFERVRGVDATAVRSCFNATKQLLAQHGIVLVFCSVPHDVERLLRAHDVIEQEDGSGTGSLVFDSVDKALEWCEDELLASEGILPLSERAPQHGDGECTIQVLNELLPKLHDENDPSSMLTDEIGQLYVEHVVKHKGEFLYSAGFEVVGVYFIGYGKIDVFMPSNVREGMGPGFQGKKRILRVCQGGIVGASEMILNKRHQFTAEAKSTCFLFFLSKAKYKQLQKDHPQIAARFQQAMLQSMARSVMESNIADD